jgi:hypothetical protein
LCCRFLIDRIVHGRTGIGEIGRTA